jgi:hypothetical protein
MDCCGSTSRRARTWLRTAPRTWPRSLRRSTPGPAKPRPWPNYYGQTQAAQTPVLRRPLESAQLDSITSPRGDVTTITYDAIDRVTGVTQATNLNTGAGTPRPSPTHRP